MPIDWVTTDFWLSFGVGFVAQLIDGALGMAYGVVSTTFLLSIGVPPAQASAMVHTAEIFTTGASGISHAVKRNVQWGLAARLAVAGAIGGAIGAYFLSNIDGDVIRPFVSAYLLTMGVLLLATALRGLKDRPPHVKGAIPLGLVGGFMDASGGGGWGPVVTSTLLGRGHAPRMTIGSVNLAEFVVTVVISAVFFIEIGLGHLGNVAGLLLGGVLAAPLAAHMVKIAPPRILMGLVGFTVVALALWQLRMVIVSFTDTLWPAVWDRIDQFFVTAPL